MKKNIARYAIRFLLITVALTVLAPLLPGVEFTGSIFSAGLLGVGLLLAYEATKWLSKKYYCIPEGAFRFLIPDEDGKIAEISACEHQAGAS